MTRSLPLITALLLSAAVPARAAGSPPVIDTAYWTEQPYCSGRYQLRLPAQRHHGSTSIDYNGWSVMVMFNDWDRNFKNINRFKRSGQFGTDIVVDTRTLITERAMMQVIRGGVHWENIIGRDGMPYEAYLYFKLDTNDAYIVRSFFYIPADNKKAPANWKAKEKELIEGMEKKFSQDLLNNLRVRQKYELTNRHGI